ncbi:MAG TPA: hypothetical protein VGM82_13440 [Gemmatimonadaceae bacterium]
MLSPSLLFGFLFAAAPVQSPARPVADTLFLTETASYTLLAVRRSDLPPGAAFDEAATRYVQLFGKPAPHVFMLIDSKGSSDTSRPPEAPDTVRIAPSTTPRRFGESPSENAASADSLDQLVTVMASAWLHAAIEASAITTGGNPHATLPQWLTSGATMLIAYGEVDWTSEMSRAERAAGVLSLAEVFSVGDAAEVSDDRLLAENIEAAALIEFLAESYPNTIDGLMARIAHGASPEVAVLEDVGVTTPALEAQWRAWYRNIIR